MVLPEADRFIDSEDQHLMKRIALIAALFTSSVVHGSDGDVPQRALAATDKKPLAAALSTSSEYELRGFFGADQNLEVSVARKGEKRSAWIKVGQRSGDMLIESADSQAGIAILVVGGVRTKLLLASPSKDPSTQGGATSPKLSDAEIRTLYQEVVKYQSNLTVEQNELIRGRIRSRIEKMRAELHELGEEPDFNDIKKEFKAGYLDALEEAAKMPGKDGRVSPVPASLLTLNAIPEERLFRVVAPTESQSERPPDSAAGK